MACQRSDCFPSGIVTRDSETKIDHHEGHPTDGSVKVTIPLKALTNRKVLMQALAQVQNQGGVNAVCGVKSDIMNTKSNTNCRHELCDIRHLKLTMSLAYVGSYVSTAYDPHKKYST